MIPYKGKYKHNATHIRTASREMFGCLSRSVMTPRPTLATSHGVRIGDFFDTFGCSFDRNASVTHIPIPDTNVVQRIQLKLHWKSRPWRYEHLLRF